MVQKHKLINIGVAVITGGASGIGRSLSEGFHQAGYKVVALDISKGKSPLSPDIDLILTDLRSEEAVQRAFDQIRSRYAQVTVLINNGAIAHFSKPLNDLTSAEFDEVIHVNLRGAFLCCKAFIEANKGLPYGRIINMASTRWQQNEAGWDAYGASKGGLVAMTSSMAVSLSETPITVNAISPGWIQVEDYEALTKEDHLQHPSGRVGRPEDIVRACLFLAHEENDFINGHNLVIDGGMSKKMIYT